MARVPLAQGGDPWAGRAEGGAGTVTDGAFGLGQRGDGVGERASAGGVVGELVHRRGRRSEQHDVARAGESGGAPHGGRHGAIVTGDHLVHGDIGRVSRAAP